MWPLITTQILNPNNVQIFQVKFPYLYSLLSIVSNKQDIFTTHPTFKNTLNTPKKKVREKNKKMAIGKRALSFTFQSWLTVAWHDVVHLDLRIYIATLTLLYIGEID